MKKVEWQINLMGVWVAYIRYFLNDLINPLNSYDRWEMNVLEIFVCITMATFMCIDVLYGQMCYIWNGATTSRTFYANNRPNVAI